jgi:hypothetical protein
MPWNEAPGIYRLDMDRGEPLGNSEDTFGRRALHVKIGNKDTESIPVRVVSGSGVAKSFPVTIATTPGTEQTVITETVPVGKKWTLVSLQGVSNFATTYRSFLDDTPDVLIGSTRTGPGKPSARFEFDDTQKLSSGATVLVKLKAGAWTPIVDAEVYLHYLEEDA